MIQPKGFTILVRPDAAKNQMKTEMIEIPQMVLDRERHEVTTGIIVAVSPLAWKGILDGTPWAEVGSHVIYAKHGGKNVEDPETGEKFILLIDKDVLGII